MTSAGEERFKYCSFTLFDRDELKLGNQIDQRNLMTPINKTQMEAMTNPDTRNYAV